MEKLGQMVRRHIVIFIFPHIFLQVIECELFFFSIFLFKFDMALSEGASTQNL